MMRRIAQADTLVVPGHYAHAAGADKRGLFTTMPPEYIEIKQINMGHAAADARQRAALEMGKNACVLLIDSRELSEPVPAWHGIFSSSRTSTGGASRAARRSDSASQLTANILTAPMPVIS